MKNFNEIYEEVLKNSKEELETLRKKFLFGSLFSIIGMILIFLIFYKYLNAKIVTFGIFPCIFIAIFVFYDPKKRYNLIYKQKVIKTFIEFYDEDLKYNPSARMPQSIYKNAGFEDNYDRYYSDDLIIGNIDGHEIMMGEVHTQRKEEHTDSDGDISTSYVTIFHGMFGNVKINNKYNGEIKIHSDKGKLGNLFNKKTKIEMDSTEFEKYFDVAANDKIQAMQILTSDIMEQMINFINESKIKFELTINQNELYIRFKTGKMFEANIFKSSVDFNTLKKAYDIINFTFDITRKLTKVLEETEI